MDTFIIQQTKCPYCSKTIVSGFSRCAVCLDKARQNQRRFIQKNRMLGLCDCGQQCHLKGIRKQCKKCLLRNIAKLTTGSTKNSAMIETIINQQEYRCAYTDEVLEIGVNASLDHKTPVSRGGSKDNPANLQWVSERINRMKTDFSHDEFVAMCSHIVEHTKEGRAYPLVIAEPSAR